MRKTLIIAALAALVASGPVLAGGRITGAAAIAEQRAAASNEGVQLTNTFEAPDSDGSMKTVPDVSAPIINAAPETCGIPVAGGVAWMGFGVSGGTAYTDQACVDRLDARQLTQMGQALGGENGARVIVGAVELMCEGKKQKALARAGITCGEQEVAETAETSEPLVRTSAPSDDAFAFQSMYGE